MALDWHTVESRSLGQDSLGHAIFDTTRTEIGELLFQYKYRGRVGALNHIVQLAMTKLNAFRGRYDVVVPIPPSSPVRIFTLRIASGIASGLKTKCSWTALQKTKATEQLKTISDPLQRKSILLGVYSAAPKELKNKTVLLVDDVYRSGATMEAAAETLSGQGQARAVHVLAITRTRVNR